MINESDHPIYNPDQHATYQFDAPYFGTPERTFETEKPRTMTDYKDLPVDVEEFYDFFVEFLEHKAYPIQLVTSCLKRARMYVTESAQCDYLDGEDRKYARFLLAAHMIIMVKKAQAQTNPGFADATSSSSAGQFGGTVGIVTNSSVGGVSVGLTLPQSQNAWEFWLNQTQYGIQYQAFLSNHAPCGIYGMGDDIRACLRD